MSKNSQPTSQQLSSTPSEPSLFPNESSRRLRTLRDLTDRLLAEVDDLVAGKTNPARLNAVTNATGKFISAIRIQLEYAKARGFKPQITSIGMTEHKSA